MKTCICLIILTLCASALASATSAADDPVVTAYQQRMAGHSDEARQHLQTLTAAQPALAAAWFELARTQFYLMQLDEAQKSIDKALEIEANNPRFHHLAGTTSAYRAVLAAKKPETRDQVGPGMQRWIRELEQAIALEPKNFAARVELVNAYRQAPAEFGGDTAKADALLTALDTESPVDGATARAATLGDQTDEALALWKKTVAANANDAAAHAGLAQALLAAKEPEKATAEVQRAVELDGKRIRVYLDLARTAGMRGEFADATAAVKSYLAANPAPAAPLRAYGTFLLAAIEKRQQHHDQAEKLLQEARDIDAHVWTTLVPPPEILFDPP